MTAPTNPQGAVKGALEAAPSASPEGPANLEGLKIIHRNTGWVPDLGVMEGRLYARPYPESLWTPIAEIPFLRPPAESAGEVPVDLEGERKVFEKACYPNGFGLSRNNTPGTDLEGYQDAYVQHAWEAWKARAALSSLRGGAKGLRPGDLDGYDKDRDPMGYFNA